MRAEEKKLYKCKTWGMLRLTLESLPLSALSVQSVTERERNESIIFSSMNNISVRIKKYTYSDFRRSCSKFNIVKSKGIVCIGQTCWILGIVKKKKNIYEDTGIKKIWSMGRRNWLLLTLFINWPVRFCIVFTMWIFMKCIALERHCLNLAK